jgi:hypothetical protein
MPAYLILDDEYFEALHCVIVSISLLLRFSVYVFLRSTFSNFLSLFSHGEIPSFIPVKKRKLLIMRRGCGVALC